MIDENEIYDDEILDYDNSGEFVGTDDDDYLPEGVDEDFEFFDEEGTYQSDDDGEFAGVSDDDVINEIDYDDLDFSSMSGKDFKGSFKKLNKQVERSQERKIKKISIPRGRPVIVEGMKRPKQQRPQVISRTERFEKEVVKKPLQKRNAVVKKSKLERPILSKKQLIKKTVSTAPSKRVQTREIGVTTGARILGQRQKKISKVIVPRDKKVIVEGVSRFILSRSAEDEAAKKIGYYKGKKLKELILIIDNSGPNPFTVDLFNPSMPLDYLYNTSLNLNDKISVANSPISYSDVLFNLLANPTMIMNAVFIFGGTSSNLQQAQALRFTNKDIAGTQEISPVNISLQVDTMQVFSSTVNFHIEQSLGRTFIPDGMETIKYDVLPGSIVTMAFYYRQKSLKKFFYKQATRPRKMI